MRDYGKVLPRFWTGGSGRKLRGNPDAQLLILYLMTCPAASMTGLYTIAIPTMAHDTGLGLERTEDALALLDQQGIAHFDPDEDLIWVVDMATVQIGERIRPLDKRLGGVIREIAAYRGHPFAKRFWDKYQAAFSLPPWPPSPLEGASEPLLSQEQDQDQDHEQEQEQDLGENPPGSSGEAAVPLAPAPTAGPARALVLAAPPSEPAVLAMPLTGGAALDVTSRMLDEYRRLYPAIDDVQLELMRCADWLARNPDRRSKSRKGALQRIATWLTRAHEQAARGPRPGAARASPAEDRQARNKQALTAHFLGRGGT